MRTQDVNLKERENLYMEKSVYFKIKERRKGEGLNHKEQLIEVISEKISKEMEKLFKKAKEYKCLKVDNRFSSSIPSFR